MYDWFAVALWISQIYNLNSFIMNPWFNLWWSVFYFNTSDTEKENFNTWLQLIVWAPTREKAIERMKRALDDTIITGNLKR